MDNGLDEGNMFTFVVGKVPVDYRHWRQYCHYDNPSFSVVNQTYNATSTWLLRQNGFLT